MPYREITPEQYAKVDELLAAGETIQATSDQTGVSVSSIAKRLRKGDDPRPGGSKRRGGRPRNDPDKPTKKTATDEQLTDFFGKAATLPAVPMALVVKCDYCTEHFARNGPKAAAELVKLSKDYPALQSVLQNIWRYWEEVAWVSVLGMYVGVPVAHHVAPDFIYKWFVMFGRMPPRVPESDEVHSHTHSQNGNGDIPEWSPFAQMDTDTLLRMAEDMGIEVDRDALAAMMESDATGPVTETEIGPEASAESPEEQADAPGEGFAPPETLEADQDTGE